MLTEYCAHCKKFHEFTIQEINNQQVKIGNCGHPWRQYLYRYEVPAYKAAAKEFNKTQARSAPKRSLFD